jgi:hypothetical protein
VLPGSPGAVPPAIMVEIDRALEIALSLPLPL